MNIQVYFGDKLMKFESFEKMYLYVESKYDVYNCNISNYEEYIRILNDKIYESQLISSPIDKVISIVSRRHKIELIKEPNHTIKFRVKDNLESIINSFKPLGWNFSSATIDTGKGFPKKYKDIEKVKQIYKSSVDCIIYVSAINDIEVTSIPDILYHVSLSCFESKISKHGLIPKSDNKINIHDDRVYMFIDYDKNLISNFCKRLVNIFDDKYLDERYEDNNIIFNIYKIDLTKTDKRNIRLFTDPYFKKDIAVYSRNGIPPICLSIIDTINIKKI